MFSGVILAVIATSAGLWLATGQKRGLRNSEFGTEEGKKMPVSRGKEVAGDDHPSPQSSAGTSRQPLQFRAKPVEPAAVLGVLATGKQTVNERVRLLQTMRGISFSKEERESAIAFLAGKDVPQGMRKGSMQWLADELLSALRLQEPPQDGLAEELAKDSNTTLAVRVTALSIAGDGGGAEVKRLVEGLIQNPGTPVILRKVAERVGER